MTMDETPNPDNSAYLQRVDVQGHLKVLEVLREWDPIGVVDLQNPGGAGWDEYDSYAPTLIQMLDRGDSARKIVKWMRYVATDYMGLSFFDKAHSRACAEKIIEFWRTWKKNDD